MKKIVLFLLLLLVFTTNINAATYRLVSDGYKINNVSSKRILIDNRNSYCIEPGIIEGTSNYTQIEFENKYDKLSKAKKDKIVKIGLYGEYLYNSTKNLHYHYAAQELIWDQIGTKNYRYTPSVSAYKTNIEKYVNAFDDVIKDNNKNFNVITGQKVVINDAKFANYTIMNKVDFEKNTGLKVSFSNNTLTIENPLGNTKTNKQSLKFKKFINTFKNGVSYAHYNKTTQNYVSIMNNYNIEMKVDFSPKTALGSLEGYKNDNHNQPLKDVIYGVYDNDKLIEKLTTNKDGYFKSGLLNVGKYQVKEISTLPNYELDTKSYEVEIKMDQVSKINNGVPLINNLKKGKIKFNKIGKNKYQQLPLANIEYGIYNKEDQLVQKVLTDNNGVGISSLIEYGEYYLRELKTNEDYLLDTNKYKFSLYQSELSLNEGKPFINQEKEYQFKIKKVDSLSKKTIKGAKFEIYHNEELFQSFESKGEDVIGGLLKGCYLIKEVEAPSKYKKSDKEYKVCFKSDDYVKEVEIVIENQPVYSLKIIKLDQSDHRSLSGVEFEIKGNNYLKQAITDKNGFIELELNKSCYDIKETKALNNYILDNTVNNVCFKDKFQEELKVYNKKEILVNTGTRYQRNYLLVGLISIIGISLLGNYLYHKLKD